MDDFSFTKVTLNFIFMEKAAVLKIIDFVIEMFFVLVFMSLFHDYKEVAERYKISMLSSPAG